MGRAHIASSRQGFSLVGEQDIQELYPTPFGDRSPYPERLVIRDSKTSKKSPNKDAAENSDQLGVYALASQILDGRLPDEMTLDYLVQTPKTQKRYVKTISIEMNMLVLADRGRVSLECRKCQRICFARFVCI
jgi:hypothetical protein